MKITFLTHAHVVFLAHYDTYNDWDKLSVLWLMISAYILQSNNFRLAMSPVEKTKEIHPDTLKRLSLML